MIIARSAKSFLLLMMALSILFPALVGSSLPLNYASSVSYPPYARVGAQAFYSGNGGFIAFLSGVSGNISYYVSDVYPNNNSMRIFVNENISLGTEAGVNTSTISANLTDSIFAPGTFPAVPPSNLTSGEITFENTTCKFVQNIDQTVPAGTFNTTEFQGKSANGTVLDLWFDRSTGLAIQMVQSGSYLQLVNSTVAVPIQTQSSLEAELPFIIVFVVGWAGAGVLFFWVRRYYVKKSERENKAGEVTTPTTTTKSTKETNLRTRKKRSS